MGEADSGKDPGRDDTMINGSTFLPFPKANDRIDGPAKFICRCGSDAWIAWWGGGTKEGMDEVTRKHYTEADGILAPKPGATPVMVDGAWVWQIPVDDGDKGP